MGAFLIIIALMSKIIILFNVFGKWVSRVNQWGFFEVLLQLINSYCLPEIGKCITQYSTCTLKWSLELQNRVPNFCNQNDRENDRTLKWSRTKNLTSSRKTLLVRATVLTGQTRKVYLSKLKVTSEKVLQECCRICLWVDSPLTAPTNGKSTYKWKKYWASHVNPRILHDFSWFQQIYEGYCLYKWAKKCTFSMCFTKTVAQLLQPKWSRKWSHTKMIARSKTSAKKMKTMIMIDHFSV